MNQTNIIKYGYIPHTDHLSMQCNIHHSICIYLACNPISKVSLSYICCTQTAISLTPTRPLSYSRPLCMLSFDLDFIVSVCCLPLWPVWLWPWALFLAPLAVRCRPSSRPLTQNSISATTSANSSPPIKMKNKPATWLSDNSLWALSRISWYWHTCRSRHHFDCNRANWPDSISDNTAKLIGALQRNIEKEKKNYE